MTQTFGDLELAAKTKEVLSTIVRKEVEKLRPVPRYATVATLEPLTVVYSGDPTPMPVKTGSIVPNAVGQVVRIEGPLGDRYIADVVGVADPSVPPYTGGDGNNEFPDGVIIGGGGAGTPIPVLPTKPGVVPGLTVTQGLEFENIYFIVEWDAVANAVDYEVEVAEKLGANVYDLARVVRSSGALVARVDGLQPFTEYGVRVAAISNIGLRSDVTAWLDITTTGDNTIPPQVSAPTLSRGATSLIVSFDPLDPLAAPDVANGNGIYEVQADTSNTFNTPNLRTYLGTSSIIAFSDITIEATWHVRVRAIDTSGNLGAWSNVSSIVAGSVIGGHIAPNAVTVEKIADGAITSTKITSEAVTAPKIMAGAVVTSKLDAAAVTAEKIAANAVTSVKIEAGAITTDKLGANSVSAAKIVAGAITSDKITTAGLDAAIIKFGTMTGDRIATNSLDVNKLTSSTLTATTITLGSGGQIKIGNPTYAGLYINNLGIRAYNNYATTFSIDASGNATFGGTLSAGVSLTSPQISGGTITGSILRSAHSGQRVEISGTSISFIDQYGEYAYLRANGGKLTVYGSGNIFGDGHIHTYRLTANYGIFDYVNCVGIYSVTTGPLTINGSGGVRLNGPLILSSGQVERGPMNSGGTGYRYLRVPN